MYLFENPVLQRELLLNLRMKRAFILMFAYLAALGGVVYLAWPRQERIDLLNPVASQRLVNLFFLGQYLLASLMAPSFAAGAITGEKERKSAEMLLASPLAPGAILLGKLLASLAHLALFVLASLPIVVLCLPLGGVSLYEVLAAYVALLTSTITFGMISLACSAYFQRTSASLLVSYLLILPLAMAGSIFWWTTSDTAAGLRLVASITVVPAIGIAIIGVLFVSTTARLLHPPDVGSEGKEVVDAETEMQQAVGLVIQRGQFPDSLFAPAMRDDLLPDGANPVFDKEMRSEIFSQGTLMLRVVIQISMLLAIPLMFFCFYHTHPEWAPWYVCYVLLFNVLVGPVFSAGSVTSERERETLELLLTTILSPWQILWAKLVSGLRVSSVLTMFLVWPLLLACGMVRSYWINLPALATYVLIITTTCLTTGNLALFCSVLMRKTSVALMTTYLLVLGVFLAPPAASFFARTFFAGTSAPAVLENLGIISPFSAALGVPLEIDGQHFGGDWRLPIDHLAFALLLNLGLLATMSWLFRIRWRVARE